MTKEKEILKKALEKVRAKKVFKGIRKISGAIDKQLEKVMPKIPEKFVAEKGEKQTAYMKNLTRGELAMLQAVS